MLQIYIKSNRKLTVINYAALKVVCVSRTVRQLLLLMTFHATYLSIDPRLGVRLISEDA